MRILVVEDEPKMTALLARALTEEGHTVDTVADGRHAVAAVDGGDYDAVVLDVMLPGIDGFEVCARLRRQRVWTPVLMLTARGAVTDRIAGLDGGADDYLTKPFNLDELFARLRALSRRGPIPRPPTLEAGDLRLDPSEHRVWRADTEIRLSHKESSPPSPPPTADMPTPPTTPTAGPNSASPSPHRGRPSTRSFRGSRHQIQRTRIGSTTLATNSRHAAPQLTVWSSGSW